MESTAKITSVRPTSADHHEQRRGDAPAVLDGEELLAVEFLLTGISLAQQFQRRVVLQVGLLAGGPPHLDAGEDAGRHRTHTGSSGTAEQPAAHQDHDGAQHDGADDADHQHPLLVGRRHREVGEDHQEDKDVVDRQALLDQVAGQELQRLGVRQLGGAGAVLHAHQNRPLKEAQGDPDQRPVQCLLDADVVRTLLPEHHEVDEQRHHE
jgi:hypothetical protein